MSEAFNKLNDRQKDFVLNYIQYRVAAKAYEKAYSDEETPLDYDTCRSNGSRLLTNADINEAIREKIDEIWKNKEQSISSIFDEFRALGFSDINNIMEMKDGILSVRDFDAIDTRAIKKIKIKEVRTESNDEKTTEIIEIELHDKKGSLAELADILGIKNKKIDLNVQGSLIDTFVNNLKSQ